MTVAHNKVTLRSVPSGTIDIVSNDSGEPILQFNCSCDDALPYCKAMCCKGRPIYNVTVPEDRTDLDSIKYPYNESLRVLQCDGNCCKYLSKENRCSIQNKKPPSCTSWHCSPGGFGENLKERATGWVLRIAQSIKIYEIISDIRDSTTHSNNGDAET